MFFENYYKKTILIFEIEFCINSVKKVSEIDIPVDKNIKQRICLKF